MNFTFKYFIQIYIKLNIINKTCKEKIYKYLKMKENFENFRSNEEVDNFTKNCNKLANYTDLDPLKMKLKYDKEK